MIFEIKLDVFFDSHRLIDDEQPQSFNDSGDFGWKQYYNLSAIYGWLDQMLEKHPKVLTNYNFGKSYEGRTLRAIKVSHKKVCTMITQSIAFD